MVCFVQSFSWGIKKKSILEVDRGEDDTKTKTKKIASHSCPLKIDKMVNTCVFIFI